MKAGRSGHIGNVELLTLGHGTHAQDELADLISGAGIERVIDVRTIPKSRTHPWVWSDKMALWVPEQAHAEYVWERDLGGFRTPTPASHNTGLRNSAFRGYADYMETERFLSALWGLVDSLPQRKTAIMCSETLWWRCHRRLIADAAVLLHGVDVRHLMANGRMQPHALTQGVRRDGGLLRYDVDA
jgi:uncharacterized protein (DUF488 family)